MPADWYPSTDAGLIPWHTTFALEVSNYQATMTSVLTNGVEEQVTTNRDVVILSVNRADEAKNYASEVVAFKDVLLKGPTGTPLPAAPTAPAAIVIPAGAIVNIQTYTRNLVAQIKAHPAYTPAIGQAMGIVGSAPVAGTPSVHVQTLTQYQVQLSITKAGYSLIAIDSKRGDEPWSELIRVSNTPYIDNRPPLVPNTPELREYRVQGVQNNARVGAVSEIASSAATA